MLYFVWMKFKTSKEFIYIYKAVFRVSVTLTPLPPSSLTAATTTYHVSHFTVYISQIIYHKSHFTNHISHFTNHITHITFHILYFTKFKDSQKFHISQNFVSCWLVIGGLDGGWVVVGDWWLVVWSRCWIGWASWCGGTLGGSPDTWWPRIRAQ